MSNPAVEPVNPDNPEVDRSSGLAEPMLSLTDLVLVVLQTALFPLLLSLQNLLCTGTHGKRHKDTTKKHTTAGIRQWSPT